MNATTADRRGGADSQPRTHRLRRIAHRAADGSAVEPVAVRSGGAGITKHAEHPAAAALVTESLLTDRRQIVVGRDARPGHVVRSVRRLLENAASAG